jgi:hypothetical protein
MKSVKDVTRRIKDFQAKLPQTYGCNNSFQFCVLRTSLKNKIHLKYPVDRIKPLTLTEFAYSLPSLNKPQLKKEHNKPI